MSKRISELPESTDLYEGSCMPVVTNGVTKKVTYGLMKQKLQNDLDFAKTIAIDSTVTGQAGTDALVENVGTTKNPRFKFTIPRGERGLTGAAAQITEVTATIGTDSGTPTVEVTEGGTVTKRTFDFAFDGLKGEKGDKGDAGTIEAGTIDFESFDVADELATEWTTVAPAESGELITSLFSKMSKMFKNIRYLFKVLGTTDISSIGNGTVTGAINKVNNDLSGLLIVREVLVIDATFPTNPYIQNSITPPTIDGYSPIGVVGYRSNAVNYIISRASFGNGKVYLTVYGKGGSQCVSYAQVLYIKSVFV